MMKKEKYSSRQFNLKNAVSLNLSAQTYNQMRSSTSTAQAQVTTIATPKNYSKTTSDTMLAHKCIR